MAKSKLGQLDCLELGNLDAKCEWGLAKEYVEGIWRMQQADEPDTLVLATNHTETVRYYLRMAFTRAEASRWTSKAAKRTKKRFIQPLVRP